MIFDPLPDRVEIGGKLVPIETDFRAGIRFETEILDGCSDEEKLLRIYYPSLPRNRGEALQKMLWFYRCGEEVKEDNAQQWNGTTGRTYDFKQDADALYASFYQVYGIDLSEIQMHWWKFRRLMFGLPPECRFMQIVHYRTVDLKDIPKSQRKHYEKCKKQFAIQGDSAGQKLTLVERNQKMKDYVERRFAACKD